MAVIRVSMDTLSSPPQSLSPLGLELISGTLDLLYFACLRAQRDFRHIPVSDYSVVIDQIDFSNPINIWATFKNAFVGTVRSVLDRMACTRFRRHRVRCFDGTGGVSWRDGSLHASSSLRLCG